MAKQHLHVAVGVVVRDDKCFLTRRAAHQHQGGKWEFPGGKVEEGESTADALHRELQEEISISVTQCRSLLDIKHDYPDKSVWLDVLLVTDFDGEPCSLEGLECQWVNVSELGEVHFPEANQPIVEAVQQLF